MKAIYVRTSVADADGAAQLHQLRQAAAARGWADWKEYIDLGQSGGKASRPALDELRADDWELIQPPDSHWQHGFALPRMVRNAGGIVQTCCLKTHRYGGHFTLSLKNCARRSGAAAPKTRRNESVSPS